MDESRHGWRRGGKGRGTVTSSGKGWQSRKQPAAKTGTSRHRTRLVALGLATVTLLAVFIILVLIIPLDMPLVVLGVASYDAPIPPNSYVSEDAARLAKTNKGNIKLMSVKPDRITEQALGKYLKENLRPRGSFVNKKLVTIYLSAHGVVDSQGRACLLLSDSKPLDESTWMPMSKLFKLLNDERPDAVKVLLLDSGKIDANWSLGILHNAFPDRVAEELRNHSKIFVMTDRASGQLAWSAPERGGTIFGHFVASGLSKAADADRKQGVSLLEFYNFVRSNVDGWVSNHRSSRQTPQLMPLPNEEQNIKLVAAGLGPSEDGSAGDRISKLSSDWQEKVLPLWERYEKFVPEADLGRYDPLGLAAIEAGLLRAEQLLLAGGAYKVEYSETLKNVAALMSDAAKPSLPDELRGFSIPLAAQLDRNFDPATSGQDVLAAWVEAGGWPKDEEGQEKVFSLQYLEAANVASRWLLGSASEPGGPQLREAIRLVKTSDPYFDDRGNPIEHVQEIQLLQLAEQYADVTDAENWPRALRVALRQAMLAQQQAEQIAAPADERVHYWVQPILNAVDQRRRIALDRMFVGDDTSLAAARDELAKCLDVDGAAAQKRLDEVTAAYELRDRVLARLPYIALWLSLEGRLGAVQPDLGAALQRVADLSELLDADDTAQPLEFTAQHQAVVDALRAASEKLESEFKQRVTIQLVATPASGTLLKTHRILRTPLTTASDRKNLFQDRYLASMKLERGAQGAGAKTPLTEPPKLTDWRTHPAVLLAGQDESKAAGESDVAQDKPLSWFNLQGGFVRDAIGSISDKRARLERETEELLRSEDADATARRTRLGLAKADQMVRSAAVLLGQRPRQASADPTRRLRHVDRHFQLLWHCDRVLEDFWGPTKSLQALPYFANVADSYLKGAKTLAPASSVLGYAEEADLKRLRDRRLAATKIGITEGAELKCFEPTDTREHEFRVIWKPDLPQGQAAVFMTERVDNDPARLFPVLDKAAQVRRRGHEVPSESSTFEQRLELEKPTDHYIRRLDARVLFRGHEQNSQFMVAWPRHVLPVRADYTHPKDAKVTVKGDEERAAYIMFIVDCSGTMGENYGGSNNTRMESARACLSDVVDELGAQPNYKIGLRAYGRRSGWKTKKDSSGKSIGVRDAEGNLTLLHLDNQGQMVEVSKQDGNKWLHPDEDANDLLVRFGEDDQVKAVKQSIPKLTPRGVTPLYRALVTSLSEDFKEARGDDSKHIVLITDGKNEVSGKAALGHQVRPTFADAVDKAWQGARGDVQIHIIFMDPPEQVADELKNISEKTGGNYEGANEALALAEAVREAVGLVEFSVEQPGSSNPETKYRLGEIATVTQLRPDCEVRVHGAPSAEPTRKIRLDGGEAVKLIYQHPLGLLPRLMFPIENPARAYSDAPIVSERTRGGDSHRFIIRAFRPDVKGADVDFFVTVQDVTGTRERDSRTDHFTPPVRQVWCEITPVLGNAPLTDQRYYFFDVDNELNEPIPKLRFHAKDWPRAATKAWMRVWFSFEPFHAAGADSYSVEIGESVDFSVPGPEGGELNFHASLRGLSEDGPYRLEIEETNTSLGTAAIIVSPEPDAISHVFYSFGAAGDVVRHVYEFKDRLTASMDVQLSSQFKQHPSVISVPQLDVLVEE